MTLGENPPSKSDNKENTISVEDLCKLTEMKACIDEVYLDETDDIQEENNKVVPKENIPVETTIAENNTETPEIANNEVNNENSTEIEESLEIVIETGPSRQDIENLFSDQGDIFKFGSLEERGAVIKYLLTASAEKWEKIKIKPRKFYEKRIISFIEEWKETQKDIQLEQVVEVKKEQVEVKKEQVEVKEKQKQQDKKEFKQEEKKSVNFKTTFEDIMNAEENKNKSTSELLVILLNTENLPEKDKKNFEEYQQLLSFSKNNEAFTQGDNAEVEKIIRKHLSSPGGSMRGAVQELYESPVLLDNAREALAKEYGIPQKIMPMRTEKDIENMADEKEKIKNKTEAALSLKKEAIKKIEKRAEDLQDKKNSGETLTEEEEKELVEIEDRLEDLRDEQGNLEEQLDDLTTDDGDAEFKLRMHDVYVTREVGGLERKILNAYFRNTEGVSKFIMNSSGREFEQQYEDMTVYDAFGGEKGAARKLFGVALNDDNRLQSKGKIGNYIGTQGLLHDWGLDMSPGVVMSAHDQAKLYTIGQCFDGPGDANESLKMLGILDEKGSFKLKGWIKAQNYIKENINNENELTFRAMSVAMNKAEADTSGKSE